jgi:hypothetical protein
MIIGQALCVKGKLSFGHGFFSMEKELLIFF